MKNKDLGITLLKIKTDVPDIPNGENYLAACRDILNNLPDDAPRRIKSSLFIPILIPTALAACISLFASISTITNQHSFNSLNNIFGLNHIYTYYGISNE